MLRRFARAGDAARDGAAGNAAALLQLPHRTPFFTPRPGSTSSNDGDRDDSSSGHSTIHTAWTRPERSSRLGERSRSRRRPTRTVSGRSDGSHALETWSTYSSASRQESLAPSRQDSYDRAKRPALAASRQHSHGPPRRESLAPSRQSHVATRQNSHSAIRHESCRRAASRTSPVYATPRMESAHSSQEDLDAESLADSGGSVVRRVRSADSGASGTSSDSVLRTTSTVMTGETGVSRDYFGREWVVP